MRWRRAAVAVLASMLVGCADDPPPDAARADDAAVADVADAPGDAGPLRVGVYSEFLAYDRVGTHLDALAARGAALQLAVPASRIGDASLAALLREAGRRGVETRLWLLLATAQGYWPNETNLGVFATEARRLLDWARDQGLPVAALVFDMEPSYDYVVALRAALASDFAAAQRMMRAHRDPAAFAAARERLAALVREVQARGVRAECVTYPQVLDDLRDGDDDLQDALDVPVRGVPWDEVSFMVYQTVFAEAVRRWIGPSLVGVYAEEARAAFGERAVVALGLVGDAGIPPPTGPVYDDPAALADDVAAARAARVSRVEVYSLDGMALLGGAPRWLGATDPAPRAATRSSLVDVVRAISFGLDRDL